MANLTKEDIRSVIDIIKELYLEDMIPWICGYSGGKDSTAVVQLVWYALQELPKDKLKKTAYEKRIDEVIDELQDYEGIQLIPFSAVDGTGVDEMKEVIEEYITEEE